MKPWREYTPGELDSQYDNRSAVPNHPEIFREWERRSRVVYERVGGGRDLVYGPHPRQTLDLFVPDGLSIRPPLHVFLHGGYWQAMSKESSGFVTEGLVKAGVAVAVVNYRLCPEVSMGEIVEDVRRALAWLYENGVSHGVDATKIQVSGHNTRINDALGLNASRARALSPALSQPGSNAPLLLAVGEKESDEYHRQSGLLYEKWRAAGVPVEMERLMGHHHFSILDELAGMEGVLCRAALALWSF
jgi:arylformamidase